MLKRLEVGKSRCGSQKVATGRSGSCRVAKGRNLQTIQTLTKKSNPKHKEQKTARKLNQTIGNR